MSSVPEIHRIDCSVQPKMPYIPRNPSIPDTDPWTDPADQIASRFQGELVWSPEKIRLHLDPGQKDDRNSFRKGVTRSLRGDTLMKKLADQPVLPANILDYLLAHPTLIPPEWKGKLVFFWGTIYRFDRINYDALPLPRHCYVEGRWVRYLYRDDPGWRSGNTRLDMEMYIDYPAAVLAVK